MSQRRSRGGQSQPQSQGRGRGKRSAASDSLGEASFTHEDDDITFTQPSTSQVQRGLEKLTQAQLDQKTAEVVQYFLVKDQKKLPIRRSDLVKHVMVKEYRNVYPEILKRAKQIFEQVFGLKLEEIDTKNHIYMLINKLETAEGASLDTPTNPKMGLLFVILSTIFMKGGAVKESLIWNTLKKLRVDPGERHEDFGDVKKLVTDEFVRQRYLEYARIPHTEPIEHEFHWGQRAELEVPKIKILEFVGQIHDQDPKTWSQPYREATSNTQASTSSQR